VQGLRELDHPGCEVDTSYFSTWGNCRSQTNAQSSGPAREIEDPHPGTCLEEIEGSHSAGRLASGHDLLQAALIRDSVPAERAGI
jgi:hypothetical protein